MEKILKLLDGLRSNILKALVLATATVLALGLVCILFVVLALLVNEWAFVVYGTVFFAALVVISYFGFKQRDKNKQIS